MGYDRVMKVVDCTDKAHHHAWEYICLTYTAPWASRRPVAFGHGKWRMPIRDTGIFDQSWLALGGWEAEW